MVKHILIIKLGALGDVIRTTPLLRVLEADITWVTSSMAVPLLKDNPGVTTLLAIDAAEFRLTRRYDVVINLEDDIDSARLASAAAGGPVVGPHCNGTGVVYGASSNEWFDMSLSSRFDRQTADRLKLRNRKTYQEMMFAAVGADFAGQEPLLNLPLRKRTIPGLVGIEERAGGVWPTKRWTRYAELATRLQILGYGTTFFKQRASVVEYADDINECEFVICGDTLAMHLGLALGKRVVALFTCTSPHEIYGYGRLEKVVSPLLERYFYRREYSPEPGDAITIEDIEERFLKVAGHAESAGKGCSE